VRGIGSGAGVTSEGGGTEAQPVKKRKVKTLKDWKIFKHCFTESKQAGRMPGKALPM
jgi:hypothetical protein